MELYHEDAPKAVANMITLAEGTRPWIDSATGKVMYKTPYYDGITFHRVIAGFMNQTGSRNGTGSDGPGYSFPDEVGNGLLHDEAYVLSAANSGPHTNGSQFFTTVEPRPTLDGIHTVFGKVVSGTDVIDTINATPVSDSTPITPVVINSMTVRRVGALAIAFDEFDQGLPEVEALAVEVIAPSATNGAQLSLTQPPGSTLSVATSSDLESWTVENRYNGSEQAALQGFMTEQPRNKRFFFSSLVRWPVEARFPSSLLGKTITMSVNGGATIILTLTNPGTLEVSSNQTGTIDYERSFLSYDGYGANLFIFTEPPGLVPFRFRLGADLPIADPVAGRVTGKIFTTLGIPLSGTFNVAD